MHWKWAYGLSSPMYLHVVLKENDTPVSPRCFCNSLRCGAYGIFCYGMSLNVIIIPLFLPLLMGAGAAS